MDNFQVKKRQWFVNCMYRISIVLFVLLWVVFLPGAVIAGGTGEAEGAQPVDEASEDNAREDVEADGDDTGVVPGSASKGFNAIKKFAKSSYLALYEGLHITGTPLDIDIAAYRLEVKGKVKTPLSLSFREIKAMDGVTKSFDLVCPGFFVDQGAWTGVPVAELLKDAGVTDDAEKVYFSTADGKYESSLPLEDAMKPGVLVAYEFDGEEFPIVHGYPLRIAAEDSAGSVWVKWLGEIRVE